MLEVAQLRRVRAYHPRDQRSWISGRAVRRMLVVPADMLPQALRSTDVLPSRWPPRSLGRRIRSPCRREASSLSLLVTIGVNVAQAECTCHQLSAGDPGALSAGSRMRRALPTRTL